MLIAIAKKRLHLDLTSRKMLPFLSITIFDKGPIIQAFADFHDPNENPNPAVQLPVFPL
ncbi:MAG: hypothetical protein LAN64_11795 [Acidobacteriia bacterium]|nr:hypothetical protein [Terriglobia bacterium]